MKNVTFYLIKSHTVNDSSTLIEELVCDLTAREWRKGKFILISCQDNDQAYRLDKKLWKYNPDAFIPHNLSGEGPVCGRL